MLDPQDDHTVKLCVMGAPFHISPAADTFGGLCAVPHVRCQLGGCAVSNDKDAPSDCLTLLSQSSLIRFNDGHLISATFS